MTSNTNHGWQVALCNSARPLGSLFWELDHLHVSAASALQCFIFHSKKGPFNTSLFAWLIYLDSLQDAFSSGNFLGSKHIKLHPLDLKQIDCQVFLQRRWAYSGSAGKYSSGSATVVSHGSSSTARERECFCGEEGGGGCGRQSVAVHWPRLCRKEKSSSSWALPLSQGRRAPVLVSQVYLRFLLINFLHWVVLAQDRILPGQRAQLNKQDRFSFKKLTCLLYKSPREKGSCAGNALSQLCEAESLEVKGVRELTR